MAGGGAVVSVAAFNEMKDSMAQLVNLAQLQANSVARLQREADVSKLKAQPSKSDKDGPEKGGDPYTDGDPGGGLVWPGSRGVW